MSLYCAERKILIAGDQILPSITTNVSTWHVEPELDAVGVFLKSCKTFLDVLHPDTLILPSHRKPFLNVQHRLRQLAVITQFGSTSFSTRPARSSSPAS